MAFDQIPMKFEHDFQRQQNIAIQSSGALLAFRASDNRIALASTNCAEFFRNGLAEAPLGKHMRDIVGSDAFHALRNAAVLPSIRKRREYLGLFGVAGDFLDLTVFQSGECVVLEATRADPDPLPGAYNVLKDVLLIQDRVQSAASDDELFCNIATLLRTISGYDCVTACRYRENASEIVASSGTSMTAFETLEVNTQLHFVPSVDQQSIPVLALDDVDSFDLTLSSLRWPPVPSLDRLRRIGAAAFMTLGLQTNDRVWGYLAFLHRSPRSPNHRTRLTLSHLQPLITAKLNSFT